MLEVEITPIMGLPFRLLPPGQFIEVAGKITRRMNDFAGSWYWCVQHYSPGRIDVRLASFNSIKVLQQPAGFGPTFVTQLQKGKHIVRQCPVGKAVQINIVLIDISPHRWPNAGIGLKRCQSHDFRLLMLVLAIRPRRTIESFQGCPLRSRRTLQAAAYSNLHPTAPG